MQQLAALTPALNEYWPSELRPAAVELDNFNGERGSNGRINDDRIRVLRVRWRPVKSLNFRDHLPDRSLIEDQPNRRCLRRQNKVNGRIAIQKLISSPRKGSVSVPNARVPGRVPLLEAAKMSESPASTSNPAPSSSSWIGQHNPPFTKGIGKLIAIPEGSVTMWAYTLACLMLAGVSGQAESTRSFSEQFVKANGIRLHYLDWGGQGEPVVFLTGFGTPAATFDALAVGLRDHFHVYALTRRGFPPSQTPASGYELETLVADIVAFLDARELSRVHLVGHSLAGLELTQIASRWPGRVRSLVYLDAIADPATAHAVLQKDPLKSSPATGAVWTQISRWWSGYSVDFSGVKAPALSISALKGRHPGIPPNATIEIRERADAYWRAAAVPTQERWIAAFRRQVPHAKVITYRDASHYFYLDRSADVLAEIKKFYSTLR